MLENAVCVGGAGFASGRCARYPGKHSPRLGIPGLKYGRPLAFETRFVLRIPCGCGQISALGTVLGLWRLEDTAGEGRFVSPLRGSTGFQRHGWRVPWACAHGYCYVSATRFKSAESAKKMSMVLCAFCEQMSALETALGECGLLRAVALWAWRCLAELWKSALAVNLGLSGRWHAPFVMAL